MIFNLSRYLIILPLLSGLLSVNQLKSETLSADSLTLKVIINEVVQNHPLVKKAMEELNTSDAKIGIAHAGKLPEVDFSSSYSRIGPVSELTIPEMGSFAFIPKDNYSAGCYSVAQLNNNSITTQ